MNKKVLVTTIALLALLAPMMAISPVMATKKPEPFSMDALVYPISPPTKEWYADGIYHMEGVCMSGDCKGTLGTGTFDACIEHLSMDVATGEGTGKGTFLITIDGVGTLAGSWQVKGIHFVSVSGIFVGTHGTGDFEGVKIMGSLEAVGWPAITVDAEGTIIWP